MKTRRCYFSTSLNSEVETRRGTRPEHQSLKVVELGIPAGWARNYLVNWKNASGIIRDSTSTMGWVVLAVKQAIVKPGCCLADPRSGY